MKYSTSFLALISSLLKESAVALSLKQSLQNQEASKVYDYDFHGGVFLSTSEVNKDFCDPDSVSLSGYFGCKFITMPMIKTFTLAHLLQIPNAILSLISPTTVDGSAYDQAETKHYFYWFFEKRSTSTSSSDGPIPLLIWLNGGPGCSSMLGLLTENGPCLVNEAGDGTMVNPYSWNEVAHVLFLDQPATVGYSYGRANDSTDEMMAEDAYFFIQSFLQSEEGQKYQNSPLYLTGESYAGHYIPAISHRILAGNNNYEKNNLLHVPLAGMAIGNPWTDPVEQNKWYAEYAKENNLFTAEEIKTMEDGIPGCVENIQECEEDNNIFSGFKCILGVGTCNMVNLGPPQVHNISLYDITKPVRKKRRLHLLIHDQISLISLIHPKSPSVLETCVLTCQMLTHSSTLSPQKELSMSQSNEAGLCALIKFT
jgi:carboxypeptidase C (cathepsin A)